MDITITNDSLRVTLSAPYHPDLPPRAKALGGRWDASGRAWQFAARDEERVRELARDIYGTDGTDGTTTVRINLDDWAPHLGQQRGGEELWLAGRRIAHRPGRDQSVRLGDDVILIQGGFPPSGGSVANPRLGALPGTILEIRDVPEGHRALADERVTVIDTQQAEVDALLAERERLLARLAEIDAALPQPEGTTASTREAAQILGVSVRTVQRWAATGRVDARRDDRGRWVITITTTEEA